MKTILILVLIGILIVFLSINCEHRKEGNRLNTGTDSSETVDTSLANEYYTCPMHPWIRSDKPGACPVCGMALVKKSSVHEMSGNDLATIQAVNLSPAQRVVANVSTTIVDRRTLNKEINAVGVVDFAEPLQAKVSARFQGRIEKLFINFTGEVVKKGQPLFALHSPDLFSAEQELIVALKSYSEHPDPNQERLIDAARERLRLHFGMTETQVHEIELSRQPRDTAIFNSPIYGTVIAKQILEGDYVDEGQVLYELADLSTLWVYLEVYENDVRFIRLGHSVRISIESYPGESFVGRVTFIDPVLNGETHTERVRTEFKNPEGKLKPKMYVKAQIHVPESNSIVVPSSAVMYTGKRTVVWVEEKPNTFIPRDVVVGTSSGSMVEILNGLKEGETVVVSGGFLIDSESQLQQPVGSGGIHQHDPGGSGSLKMNARTGIDHQRHVINEIKIIVDGKYTPDVIHASKGEKVKLAFYRSEESLCSSEVVFKTFKIRKKLPLHKTTVIEFTPRESGEYLFTCGMGMMKGKLIVH